MDKNVRFFNDTAANLIRIREQEDLFWNFPLTGKMSIEVLIKCAEECITVRGL